MAIGFVFKFLVPLLICNGLIASEAMKAQVQQVYFSPADRVADHLIELIAKEKTSIKAAVYAFTHKGVAQALGRAKDRGVAVEVILDPFSLKNRGAISVLTKAGIPIFVWNVANEPNKKSLMHDKFCVFGNSVVWTGSFNFTYEADTKNEENVIVLEDPGLAARFETQFHRMKKSGAIPYEEFLKMQSKKK